ncbi:hypothetical protein TNCT_451121 [Trichonephila clavata]|uniref:Secreted protein n=1 Tax=Trichonephila clavata TaxID=2740835 RepID=A0A8X6EXY6_TRICU|nr:hypothetical protein TNCT_451121 [Trichonephila clavata]
MLLQLLLSSNASCIVLLAFFNQKGKMYKKVNFWNCLHPHSAARVQQLSGAITLEVFHHLAYSPDFAPNRPRRQSFQIHEEFQNNVQVYLISTGGNVL